jgi:hypothetical protein
MRDITWPEEGFPGTALFSSTTCLLPTGRKPRPGSDSGDLANLNGNAEASMNAQLTADGPAI